MPRHPRLRLAGVPVHVIQRGNNRGACFHGDDDRHAYLATLLAETRFRGVAVHAYVLMTNHVHLLMTPRDPAGVEQVMKLVGQRYAAYFNRRHDRVGTLWQGRYKSCLVEAESYLLTCHRYIENNPVRAGMVGSPDGWPWSSYHANALGAPDPLVTPHPVIEALAGSAEERRALYREHVVRPATPEMLEEIRDAANGGYALASGSLKAAVARCLNRPAMRGSPGRPRGDRGQKINVV